MDGAAQEHSTLQHYSMTLQRSARLRATRARKCMTLTVVLNGSTWQASYVVRSVPAPSYCTLYSITLSLQIEVEAEVQASAQDTQANEAPCTAARRCIGAISALRVLRAYHASSANGRRKAAWLQRHG